jgi:hypothetical protein
MVKKKSNDRVKRIKRGSAARKSTSASGAVPSAAALIPVLTPEQIEAAKRKYVQGIVERGEAVECGKPLPAGATHEIVGHEPDGTPILKRKRFSMR